jgi:hypothetical protein
MTTGGNPLAKMSMNIKQIRGNRTVPHAGVKAKMMQAVLKQNIGE